MNNKLVLNKIRLELKKYANRINAKNLQRFFKTRKKEYGEGDFFIGGTVPQIRVVAKLFYDKVSLSNISPLISSKIHEERLLALIILVKMFEIRSKKKNPQKFLSEQKFYRARIFRFYLKNIKYVNNWDLVDLSAPKIIGAYLFNKDRKILYKLAKSKNLWKKRIAILSTFYFIQKNNFTDSLKIAKILLQDEHDLIHKAVGWMLREIGKRSLAKEEKFLLKNYRKMPRTMLRYAIEKIPEAKRKRFLNGKV